MTLGLNLLIISSLRNKFALFIFNVILAGIWGSFFNLDGMVMVLMTAEFTIVLLFLMTYMQLYSNYQFKKLILNKIIMVLPVIFWIIFTGESNNFYYYTSIYSGVNHIVNSDFFILYYFLFELLPTVVIYLTIVISFFSLFFIILYYNLKLVKNTNSATTKQIYFLRKQNLFKQTNYTGKVFTFQN